MERVDGGEEHDPPREGRDLHGRRRERVQDELAAVTLGPVRVEVGQGGDLSRVERRVRVEVHGEARAVARVDLRLDRLEAQRRRRVGRGEHDVQQREHAPVLRHRAQRRDRREALRRERVGLRLEDVRLLEPRRRAVAVNEHRRVGAHRRRRRAGRGAGEGVGEGEDLLAKHRRDGAVREVDGVQGAVDDGVAVRAEVVAHVGKDDALRHRGRRERLGRARRGRLAVRPRRRVVRGEAATRPPPSAAAPSERPSGEARRHHRSAREGMNATRDERDGRPS